MKNIGKFLCLTLLMVCMVFSSLHAEKVKGVRRPSTPKAESATCLPASSSNELTVNNVRAYIETGGTMWFKELAEYEVPAGSGKTSMFCAALWIGGRDANGTLKLAAVRFRQVGDDYWTGPLKFTGASTTQSMCIKYDKHFKITRAEVDQHISSYNTSGYVMPSSIANWPAHGEEGYSYYLAPFKDVNGNEVYDPENGDYPYYDINNDLCPWTEENVALAAAHKLPRTPEDLWTERQNYGTSSGDFQYDYRRSNGMIYADHVLKGDATLFWIFNDNAGSHTESKGSPIGLEIRGQCFGFSTNDELNNMTFYSYEIINRSTYTLTNTFFSQWVDPDLGYAYDDYVGCDVGRGLGYCYNGNNVDGSGQTWAYGDQPPAVGVDFFQGPYMDADNRDNPKFYPDSASETYCAKFVGNTEFPLDQMAINGVNFGDSIVDNERFGMRRFVYHNNDSNPINGDPSVAVEYYNMLQGIWKDNTKMQYGGNAVHTGKPFCDFMFPGLTDVCNWGTQGVDPQYTKDGGWTEANEGNAPMDRRFMQSAGPFTLKPGSVNYITVGIPWARATQGGALASVDLLKIADDKCQALFENCFKTLDGPDAPDVTIRELENELILYISNENRDRNNYHESYVELDPQITKALQSVEYVNDTIYAFDSNGDPDTIVRYGAIPVIREDTLSVQERQYKFEGYQIYQCANASVSATDIGDLSKAILIAQCDIKNEAGQLVNWIYNDAVGAAVATEMVNGNNSGIFHSLSITEDKFATGSNKQLVNHKEYYFMVVAYGYNQYKEFKLDPDYMDGQTTPYLAGRRYIYTYTGVPHKNVENLVNSSYGDQPMITRIEGHGNGGYFLDMTDESRDAILANNVFNNVQYKNNFGPLSIKVIDPLQVKPYDYYIKFMPNSVSDDVNDSTNWKLTISDDVSDEELEEMHLNREYYSSLPISMTNEQLFLDLGVSVSLRNADFKFHQNNVGDYLMSANGGHNYVNNMWYGQVDYIGSEISFSGDEQWLSGVVDQEGDYPANWIHSGQQASGKWEDGGGQTGAEADYMVWRTEDMCSIINLPGGVNQYGVPTSEPVRAFKDPDQQFESVVGGTWSPYVLSSPYDGGPQAKFICPDETPGTSAPYLVYSTFDFTDLSSGDYCPGYNQTMSNLYSVDVVMTPDQSKWTRCVVLESGSGEASNGFKVNQTFEGQTYQNVRHEPKHCPSVGKDGRPDNSGTTGMGWFPGYAINVETGERLNIMFAENSADTLNNGNDMIFNPTSVYAYAHEMNRTQDSQGNTIWVKGDLILDDDGQPISLSELRYNELRDAYGVSYGEPNNGGRHYVYIVGSSGNTCSSYYKSVSTGNTREYKRNFNDAGFVHPGSVPHGGTFQGNDNQTYAYYDCGAYDEGRWLRAKFDQVERTNNKLNNPERKKVKMQLFSNVMWTSIPMPAPMQDANWLANDATIKIRVTRPYYRYSSRWYDDPSQAPNASQNDGYPMYQFTTKNLVPTEVTKLEETTQTLLDEINIVPNPYYGFSQYEQNALQNYVRIVNLPANCTISIYTVNGTLIRTLTKGDSQDAYNSSSYVQWDLKNQANIPIAGGVYIIHVKAPGIGERTLKFFCAMRPTDLNGF